MSNDNGEPDHEAIKRLILRRRLSHAEAAVQDASLSFFRQQERVDALGAGAPADQARAAKAELEMLEDIRQRRIAARDAVARELAQP